MNLLWLDLETTGNDKEEDEILEVGAFVTSSDLIPYEGDFEEIIKITYHGLDRVRNSEVVSKMHSGSGLLLQSTLSTVRIEVADYALCEWLFQGEDEQIMLAGSGIAYFDRRFIERFMPSLESHLPYKMLDIGHVRRYLKMQGVIEDSEHPEKPHRALADAHMHYKEALEYRSLLWKETTMKLEPTMTSDSEQIDLTSPLFDPS